MIISLIAAIGENNVIGNRGQLPWHLPADMRHFRALTLGKPVIMGRITHESIGKALSGRKNIVLARGPSYRAVGCTVARSVDEALAEVGKREEGMVIGGAEVYRQFLPRADRMYLTLVHHTFVGDVFFPAYDISAWNIVSREDYAPDSENIYSYSFVTLVR